MDIGTLVKYIGALIILFLIIKAFVRECVSNITIIFMILTILIFYLILGYVTKKESCTLMK